MTRRHSKRKKQPKPRPLLGRLTRGPWLLAIVVLGAVGAFAAILAVSLLTQGDNTIERLEGIPVEGRTRGDPDAPVTIIEFADFQCPACGLFSQTTGNDIEEEYVATGLVRFEFRNMAFIGPESQAAAEAALCANEQGKFWEYHDKLFQRQEGENRGAFSDDRLRRFAEDLELDPDLFDTCLAGTENEQTVLDETDAAGDAGVESTPYFFVQVTGSTDVERVKGGKPFDEFSRIIEQKLEEAATTPQS